MKLLHIWLTFFFLIFVSRLSAQETDTGPGYQMVLMNNPALSGSEGPGILRLSYLNYYPGNGYNLHSLYLSYDSYFQSLHGGASAYLSDNYLGGQVNEIRGGVSYSYFLQAGENLFVNAGLSASLFHRGFSFGNSVLPDQIDPLGGVVYPSAETLKDEGRTVLDLNTGITISGKMFSGGLAVMHLAEPDLARSSAEKELIRRKLFLHLCGDFPVSRSSKFYLRPLVYLGYQDKSVNSGIGLSAENEYVGVNLICSGDNSGNTNLQTGCSFKAGFVRLFYAYRFNVISRNDLLPLSLLHQTGLAFSLNDVDKRKSIKTINFPKL